MSADLKRRKFIKGAGLAGLSGLGGLALASGAAAQTTGDLGVIIERADGSVLIVDTTRRTVLWRVEGLGDLSHASAVFSRDARYVFVFGRDGGLT